MTQKNSHRDSKDNIKYLYSGNHQSITSKMSEIIRTGNWHFESKTQFLMCMLGFFVLFYGICNLLGLLWKYCIVATRNLF